MNKNIKLRYLIFKRVADILFSLVVLLFISPVLLFISILLLIEFKGNPFFIQPRPGMNNRIFKLFKFKTMYDTKDKNGELLADIHRISKIGNIVRKLSIDELPQLINVLLGDMSIVGPRPLLVDYLSLYNLNQIRRHEVRPGITGWAQINGRNAISWSRKFEFDVYYVDNLNFKLDIVILLLTIRKVILREDVNNNINTTMFKFNGKN